tara:strand:+ start:7708 stop:10083 length:2376 start_codon:yes stop_codon:yes gene_type:complete
MRVNLQWLKEWINFEFDSDELANKLTIGGLEVGSIEQIHLEAKGIVVAKIIETQPHPDADRLVICQVSTGKHDHTVVCGAPNARKGLMTAYAPSGSVFPDGRKIEATKIRNILSDGMLCSSYDLNLTDDNKGLIELESDAPIGSSFDKFLGLDDVVLDLELTPNRGDCFSILGVAREVAALTNKNLNSYAFNSVKAKSTEKLSVKLSAEDSCPRFVGRVIKGVSNKLFTPSWITERLRRVGLRKINPIVDITNYVMLELGQPLHSYDYDNLSGSINVRYGKKSEALSLLGDSVIKLDSDVLVIADDAGPVGLAGIMGGSSTAVETSTVNIFLEAAFFTPSSIIGRARKYALHTDASHRFERGVDPEGQIRAIERATELIIDIVGGEAGPTTVYENAQYLPEAPSVVLRRSKLESILGMTVEPEVVESIMCRLGMSLEKKEDSWVVTPPSFRFDINIEEDLIEEVARIIGYDTLPVISEKCTQKLGISTEKKLSEYHVINRLVERGYSEVISYGFVEKQLEKSINPDSELVSIINPLSSELSVMRSSLWPGLLGVARRNLSRQQSRIRIFEMGSVFCMKSNKISEKQSLAGLALGPIYSEHWDFDDKDVDYFDIKSDVESLFDLTNLDCEIEFLSAEHPALAKGKTARILKENKPIGWIGELHPSFQQSLELKSAVIMFSLDITSLLLHKVSVYQQYSKYPSVRRDLALVLHEDIKGTEVVSCIKKAGGELLKEIKIFDLYRGKGIESSEKSLAVGLILQHTSRTLNDTDIDKIIGAVTRRLKDDLGAAIRK